MCYGLQEDCRFNLKSCILNIGASPKPHILFFIRIDFLSKGSHERSALFLKKKSMQKNSRKNDRPPHWHTLPRVFSGPRSRDKLENDFLRGDYLEGLLPRIFSSPWKKEYSCSSPNQLMNVMKTC